VCLAVHLGNYACARLSNRLARGWRAAGPQQDEPARCPFLPWSTAAQSGARQASRPGPHRALEVGTEAARLLDGPVVSGGQEDRRPPSGSRAAALAAQRRGDEHEGPGRDARPSGRLQAALDVLPSDALPHTRLLAKLSREDLAKKDGQIVAARREVGGPLSNLHPPRWANYRPTPTDLKPRARPAKSPALAGLFRASGRRDLNSGPLVPQTSALTRLRHAPSIRSLPRRWLNGCAAKPRCLSRLRGVSG